MRGSGDLGRPDGRARMDAIIPTVAWTGTAIRIIDQTKLPDAEQFLDLTSVDGVCEAIRNLRIRGAPALGVIGGMGLALAARSALDAGRDPDRDVREAAASLRAVRPTAVNLAWGIDRCLSTWRGSPDLAPGPRAAALAREACAIQTEDLEMSKAMGRSGARLLKPGDRVLTHCNTGGLATGGLGTALAVVFEAHRQGKAPRVWADETRPLLQGSRLTAWELGRMGIPVTVLVDGAAPWLMKSRGVDVVLFGADRIARNGDTANKIGSYMLALAARAHGVPLYVVAPTSSFDPASADGGDLPIEERPAEEVRRVGGVSTAPAGVEVFNPAFDVTPAEAITGWITEGGILQPPFTEEVLAAARARMGSSGQGASGGG